MTCCVLSFDEVEQPSPAVLGGKGAHLAELLTLDGLGVPTGFFVTTEAFRRIIRSAPSFEARLGALARLKRDDRVAIRQQGGELRELIEQTPIPDDLAEAITRAHAGLGAQEAYAVRSSATAEDLPTASFAGQQDSYLNILGRAEVLSHVRRCWASLFTERAVTYRIEHGIDHQRVQMAVVVQMMVFAQAAGVVFTADPVTGNRKVTCVDASFGLGESLVAGLVAADAYKVRQGAIIARSIGRKQLAVHASPGGGTRQRAIEADQQLQPTLTDLQVVRLADIARRIEAHFGSPQDIEWCLVNDTFHVVQSRPITTLFPIPVASDGANRVYVSVGHQQMMTDPMRPLGLSFWQMKAKVPMSEAGGRLFVDVTASLTTPAGRAGLLGGLGKSDPLVGAALQAIVDRGDFLMMPPSDRAAENAPRAATASPPLEADPSIPAGLVERSRVAIAALKRNIQGKSGCELLDLILESTQELKLFLFDPTGMQVIMGGIGATWWLNEHLETWLGIKNAADVLSQSVPDNVTSQMGLALLDVADVIRRHPAVVSYLRDVNDDQFMERLPSLPGGQETRDALEGWLQRYGMRGVGEIDITRARFGERPTLLLPLTLSHVRNFVPNEAERRFEQGQRNAAQLEHEVLERLRALPDGNQKAAQTKQMIDRVRAFAGYREYPKYAWMSYDAIYKRALLEEAKRLVQAGVLGEEEEIYFLRFEELHDVVRTKRAPASLIRERKQAFESYRALKPPRVITCEGEAITGVYRREHVPAGALVGLPVCSGIVEGRARVVLDVASADLEPGDILVTTFTDPSWTPLFVGIRGLVTEVGGLMTHGAVVAREYGLPTVVGVVDATTLIKDGQHIRVDGTNGYVERLH